MENRELAAISLLYRSGLNHARYLRPGAEKEKPVLYAGKVETVILTMLLNLSGVDASDMPNALASYRALTAFHQQWRAHDEVVDERHYLLESSVTEEELDTTKVFHKFVKREVSGEESRRIALSALKLAIPGIDLPSRTRRENFERLTYDYRDRVAATANNPKYQVGEILPYPTALNSKEDVTGFLGTVFASLYSILLNRDDPTTVEFFRQMSVVLQLGDDLFDWRKDLADYFKKKDTTNGKLRPIENLLIATLSENPSEMQSCQANLTDNRRRSVVLLSELAPQTREIFDQRFQTELDKLPPHQNGGPVRSIIEYTYDKLLPILPESGLFFKWAKY